MILFAGDCHGDFVPLIEEAGPATAVVLLGDQEPLSDLAVELGPGVAPKTWWIYGNHDSDDPEYMAHHAAMADRNLHCRVVEVEGLRIAGLGGVFRSKRFQIAQNTRLHEINLDRPQDTREAWVKLRRGGKSHPADFTSIFPDDIKGLLRLAKRTRIDVLVTHEAPESHKLGFQLIGDLARALRVKMLIHGHHHERYSATLDGGIRVEGVGMAGMMVEWKRPEDGLFWWC
jgi:predicted phosphodiesterase